jgi:hypothetical protein
MSFVTDTISNLNQLVVLQKQVNNAIEMTPPGAKQISLMQQRNTARSFESTYIIPYQSQLVADAMPGFLTGIANQLAGPITKALINEAKILQNASQPTKASNLSGRFNHPLAGLGDDTTDTAESDTTDANVATTSAAVTGSGGGILDYIESLVSSPTSYTADDSVDIPAGENALNYYFTESTKFSNFPYTDLQSMLDDISAVNPELISTIGFTIRADALVQDQVQSAMVQLADKGQGNLPSNSTVFFTALTTAAENPSFWQAIDFVAANSFMQAVQGAQAIGQQLITAGANATALIQYLPYFAIAGVALWIFVEAGGIQAIVGAARGKE